MAAAPTPSDSPADGSSSPSERRRFRIQIFDARDRTALATIDETWNQLIADNTHLTSLYQSPQYLRYRLLREPGADLRVAVVRDWSRRIVGVVPMVVGAEPLKFALGGRVLAALPFRSVHLLGGHLAVPQELPLYARLFSQVFQAIPSCEAIVLDHVRPETELWRFLTRPNSLLRRLWRIYLPEGARELNTIWLDGDFRQYLDRLSPRTLDELERRRAALRDRHGEPVLERFDGVDSVGEYLRRAAAVARHAARLQENGPRIPSGIDDDAAMQLAREGLFRSYVLRCGKDDLACCTGWQHQGVFHYVKPAVDQRVAALSPEGALLYLMIEDLCRCRPATCINLFSDDGSFATRLATHAGFDASVMIVHRTPANFSRLALHRLLRTAVRIGNDFLGRPRSREWWEATITRERTR